MRLNSDEDAIAQRVADGLAYIYKGPLFEAICNDFKGRKRIRKKKAKKFILVNITPYLIKYLEDTRWKV